MARNELGLTDGTRHILANRTHIRENPEDVYSALLSLDPVDIFLSKASEKAIARDYKEEVKKIASQQAQKKRHNYGSRKKTSKSW